MTSLLAALTVKVSAVLLLALLGVFCLRRASASARHWLLAVSVVSALGVPALHSLPTEALRLRLGVSFAEQVENAPLGAAAALQPAGSAADGFLAAVVALASDPMVRWVVAFVWLLGAVASTTLLLVGLARLRRLRASSHRLTDGRWRQLCTDLARSGGLRRGVDLLLGPRPGLVATWGWRRPVVMLPASASGWPAARMRVVLLHELAHVRRGDWVLLMAAEALRCLWWFNPMAWLVRGRLRRESEQAADDLVLAQGVPPATYATHLIELAREIRTNRRTWLPAPAMARPSYLKRRLSVMLNSRTNRRPLTRLARFGSLSVLVPASILVASLHLGPVSAPGRAESIGSAGRQGQATESTGQRVEALLARLAALQAELQTVLDELHATLGTRDGVSPPRKIQGVAPVYPPEALAAGAEGVVVVEAAISSTGEVTDVEVVRSVPLLDEAAVAAVAEWRYTPALLDGEPVSTRMTVSVTFTRP
ncbi:MAG: M56 family metallopeptidase [Acidobacteria bacterium]|nr:M56 family metallopeptidase [Acidobacteriota bacterium]MYH21829.1 M56 family metallopeptidase [Acidobacteriota bacterium]MYK79454.1 M56 family metallopeptidase [Acidobacteriota bacterium]